MNRGSTKFAKPRRNQPRPGFNEAPIHESGKLGDGELGRDRRRASMRPRFMNRGSIQPLSTA